VTNWTSSAGKEKACGIERMERRRKKR